MAHAGGGACGHCRRRGGRTDRCMDSSKASGGSRPNPRPPPRSGAGDFPHAGRATRRLRSRDATAGALPLPNFTSRRSRTTGIWCRLLCAGWVFAGGSAGDGDCGFNPAEGGLHASFLRWRDRPHRAGTVDEIPPPHSPHDCGAGGGRGHDGRHQRDDPFIPWKRSGMGGTHAAGGPFHRSCGQ